MDKLLMGACLALALYGCAGGDGGGEAGAEAGLRRAHVWTCWCEVLVPSLAGATQTEFVESEECTATAPDRDCECEATAEPCFIEPEPEPVAGGDDGIPSGFGNACVDLSECDDYACREGVCTTRCDTNDDCVQLDNSAVCDTGWCFPTCMTSFDCASGLACTQGASDVATCRAMP